MKTNLIVETMTGLFFGLSPATLQYVLIALAVIHLVIVFVVASAVKNDAENLGASLFLVSPWMWFAIVLVTAYAGALAYWLIHYSSLRYRNEERS